MVADTYTTRLGLIVQGTGNNNNSWGDTFNNSFGAIVERAITGFNVHTDTGGTLDLSASPPPAGPSGAIDYVHHFTGALVSNLTVQMPNVQKTWIIDNSTSGNFSLFIRNGAAGTVVQVPQGCVRVVICNGLGNMRRADADAVGTIRLSGGVTARPGTLACNGASLLRTDFPDLFAVIGTIWGAVDGTHFTLPQMQDSGRFIRCTTGAGLPVGTYQSNQNKSHTHNGSGTTSTESASWTHTFSGTTSTESATHTHAYSQGTAGSQKPNGTGTQPFDSTSTGAVTGTQSANHTHTYSGTTSTQSASHTHTYAFTTGTGSADGTESRPESVVAYASILY